MRILVTGGAGYIGSHTALALLEAGYDVVVADNCSNSKPEAVRRMRELAAKDFTFIRCELCEAGAVDALFDAHGIDAVMHFAGYKAVGESVAKPLKYYANNLVATLNLLACMQARGLTRFVFSSSATVYGNPHAVPIREDFPLAATNPYGRTKCIIEDMLRDLFTASPAMRIALLRYFNPIGAHASGRIGEDPRDTPNNLMPYIAKVASGKLKALSIFGGDYPTHDGTGVRDYIHVTDLALGHIAALKKLEEGPGVYTYNLGTGRGTSVLEMLRAFEAACGRPIPFRIVPRRPGDVAVCFADTEKAARELNWRARYDIARMCADSWRWQARNPDGYGE